jgi:predicted TIM-barrel fold metal-dependent hydrolase
VSGADPIRVFDADVHLHELDADLAPYFELPWRRVLEEGGLAREGARAPRGERLLDVAGYWPHTAYDPILGDFPEAEPRRLTSPELLRADLDERGTAGGLVFPGRLLRAASSGDELYVAAMSRAYNRMLAERWVQPSRGIYAAIMAANQVPEEAAREIETYANVPGFAAVYLPLAGNYPLWGDRMYEPICAAAEKADLPVVLQGALTVHTVFPYELHQVPTALAKQVLSQPFGAIANLVHLVTTGVLGRHPSLRLVFNDVGLSWLPLVCERLDHFYPYLREEVPFLAGPPSESVRRQVFITTHPLGSAVHRAYLVACVEAIGSSQIMFGSDYPHFDADAASQVEALPIADAVKRRILSENARRVFSRIG